MICLDFNYMLEEEWDGGGGGGGGTPFIPNLACASACCAVWFVVSFAMAPSLPLRYDQATQPQDTKHQDADLG